MLALGQPMLEELSENENTVKARESTNAYLIQQSTADYVKM